MKRLLITLLVITSVFSCSVPYELSQKNLSDLYDYSSSFTEPSYVIFHVNDTLTQLYYTFQWSDFQYVKNQEQHFYSARIRLSLYLRESYESKAILDSMVVYLNDSTFFGHNKANIDSVLFNTPQQGEYLLEVCLKDLNRDKQIISFLPVFKSNVQDQQYYLARDPGGIPLFTPYISKKQQFTITSSRQTKGKLFVRYYKRDFPIAIPPFANDYSEPFDYREDSLFQLEINEGKTANLSLTNKGFYHFQPDTTLKEGFTLFRFSDDFPEIQTPEDALQPLRYLTTSNEYQKLASGADIKLSIDSFWLENSGNIERAKSQIAKFYNRTREANLFFTSYIEGWKTDRGMIYVVFGPPNHVYRDVNTESWVYGDAGYSLSLRFSFVKVNNPFSYNDYSLYRNPFYKEAWYNTVENWRR